jgi:hypothetical protein
MIVVFLVVVVFIEIVASPAQSGTKQSLLFYKNFLLPAVVLLSSSLRRTLVLSVRY